MSDTHHYFQAHPVKAVRKARALPPGRVKQKQRIVARVYHLLAKEAAFRPNLHRLNDFRARAPAGARRLSLLVSLKRAAFSVYVRRSFRKSTSSTAAAIFRPRLLGQKVQVGFLGAIRLFLLTESLQDTLDHLVRASLPQKLTT